MRRRWGPSVFVRACGGGLVSWRGAVGASGVVMCSIVLRDVAAGRCLGRAIVSKRLLGPRLDGRRGECGLGGLLGMMMLLRVRLLRVMLRRMLLL